MRPLGTLMSKMDGYIKVYRTERVPGEINALYLFKNEMV
jgi:hypothetical protein